MSLQYIVVTLENTVEWMMGSPAGFKLNHPLNNVLGPFYQFHISLWGTFLSEFRTARLKIAARNIDTLL